MTHPFELSDEIALDATPEQVWAAIASGPGIDSWFMGRSEIAGHEGGRNRMSLLGFDTESTTTAWEPGTRFAYRTDGSPDGTFMAFEYLIEGRDGGSTVLRYVHSGMLGDGWETEYDGLRIYSVIHGHTGAVVVQYHDFSQHADGPAIESAWQGWLARTFGDS